MSEHHGVIRFSSNDVAATIILRAAELKLFSQNAEIGAWPAGEYELVAEQGGELFTLHAEGEVLAFVPNNGARLAAELEGLPTVLPAEREATVEDQSAASEEPNEESDNDDLYSDPVEVVEGPAPSLLTRVLFYVLLLATVATGVWAVVSLIG